MAGAAPHLLGGSFIMAALEHPSTVSPLLTSWCATLNGKLENYEKIFNTIQQINYFDNPTK